MILQISMEKLSFQYMGLRKFAVYMGQKMKFDPDPTLCIPMLIKDPNVKGSITGFSPQEAAMPSSTLEKVLH